MARPIDTKRKESLRAGAADYLLKQGLPAFSLRPLAEALGTSARMLIHHFQTRENLLREALDEIRKREQAMYLDDRNAADSAGDTLRWHWHRMTRPSMRRKLPQLFQLYVEALGNPRRSAWLFENPLKYWMKVITETGGPDRAARATLTLATLRGLLLDLAAGGDRRRIESALELLAAQIDGAAPPRRVRRPRTNQK